MSRQVKNIIVKSIFNVSACFVGLAARTALSIVSLYALVNTIIYFNNGIFKNIDYVPPSFFYHQARQLLDCAATGLGGIFVVAIMLSVALEYSNCRKCNHEYKTD